MAKKSKSMEKLEGKRQLCTQVKDLAETSGPGPGAEQQRRINSSSVSEHPWALKAVGSTSLRRHHNAHAPGCTDSLNSALS